MKVAISMCCLHDFFVREELNPLSFVKYAASLMVDGVELCDRYLQKSTDLGELGQTLQENKLEVACYTLTTQTATIEDLRAALEIARKLDAAVLRIVGPSSGLPEFLPDLEEAKLTLCLDQGMQADFTSSHLKSTYAMVDYYLQGSLPDHQVGLVLANDLRFAPASEQEYLGSVLGLGLVELELILQALWELNYAEWIIVDYGGAENPLFGLEASLKNLRQQLRELQI